MPSNPKYYIIEAAALPDVFLKVAEAKRLLSTGEVSTVNEATRRTDISRSAFYKYRDAILPFQNMMKGRIITFQLMLHDEPGVLSAILEVYARHEANILTINSIIPTRCCGRFVILPIIMSNSCFTYLFKGIRNRDSGLSVSKAIIYLRIYDTLMGRRSSFTSTLRFLA